MPVLSGVKRNGDSILFDEFIVEPGKQPAGGCSDNKMKNCYPQSASERIRKSWVERADFSQRLVA